MIEVRGMAPLLSVFDMPTSLHFYCDLLGFQIMKSDANAAPNFDWVLLSLNGVELMLNTAYEAPNRPPAPDTARLAAHRDTTLYFGCPDVDGAYEHLKAAGLQLHPPKVAYYGMKQIYISDPDSYPLCFHWAVE